MTKISKELAASAASAALQDRPQLCDWFVSPNRDYWENGQGHSPSLPMTESSQRRQPRYYGQNHIHVKLRPEYRPSPQPKDAWAQFNDVMKRLTRKALTLHDRFFSNMTGSLDGAHALADLMNHLYVRVVENAED